MQTFCSQKGRHVVCANPNIVLKSDGRGLSTSFLSAVCNPLITCRDRYTVAHLRGRSFLVLEETNLCQRTILKHLHYLFSYICLGLVSVAKVKQEEKELCSLHIRNVLSRLFGNSGAALHAKQGPRGTWRPTKKRWHDRQGKALRIILPKTFQFVFSPENKYNLSALSYLKIVHEWTSVWKRGRFLFTAAALFDLLTRPSSCHAPSSSSSGLRGTWDDPTFDFASV